jgi:CRP/FNR family cyclic AMP-dependent transcriptional regulator
MSAAQRPTPTDSLVPFAEAARPRTVAVVDVDPDLGAQLSPERLAMARSELRARVLSLPRGRWAGVDVPSISPQNIGLLLIEGVMAREVALQDTVSSELVGPGDLIRPWDAGDGSELLAEEVRWQVLAEARVAVLGRAFAGALSRFPEVNAALIDRACARAKRLGTTQAISHLNSVDRRLLALFWHLAERWGRITAEGVVVPLVLSHRLLGELIGARRPTVSSAAAVLEREGTLVRRGDGSWLLTGERAGGPEAGERRMVLHRRRLLASAAQDEAAEPAARRR